MIERKVTSIAATLKNAQKSKRGCTLLVGAGCSVTAGIPTATELINQIKELKPEACEDEARLQREFNYGDWMDYLGTDERHDLFANFIDQAKINWAHICIASLMAAGYVDRILTTNFDPLIVQACALFGEFPAVYDFAASQFLRPHLMPPKAVFYLHGQRSGFILKNTPSELAKHAETLAPIINDALPRVWIVVGYSGTSDAVFQHLTSVDEFGHGLYWVGYEDREPAEHIRKGLLDDSLKKRAFYTKGYDADRFFDALIRELNIYPPRLVSEPFTHLLQVLQRVTDEEKFKDTRVMIEKAVQQFERRSVGVRDGEQGVENAFVEEALRLMNEGDYDGVIRLRPQYEDVPSQAGAEYLARAYMLKGNKYAEAAKNSGGSEHARSVEQAAEHYETALHYKPDAHEVFNNWGALLHEHARRRGPAAADSLAKVIDMYDSALRIKADYFDALLNRAKALADLSVMDGKPAAELFDRARADFAEALNLKPNSHKALTAWGEALRMQIKAQPERADSLLIQATQKYQEALKIKPEYVKAVLAWGDALLLQAGRKEGEEEERLVEQAMSKFFEADARVPGSNAYSLARYKALNGDDWGCRESLQRAKQYHKLPPPEYLENDPSFDRVRDAEWFAEFTRRD